VVLSDRSSFRNGVRATVYLVVLALVLISQGGASAQTSDPASTGEFSAPFTEPTINGVTTDEKCIAHDDHEHEHPGGASPNHEKDCKPAAGSVAILPNGEILYWNALEGTEDVKNAIAGEFGDVSINDQGRVLAFGSDGPTWTQPAPIDAGANPTGYNTDPLTPVATTESYNDGALFCSDLNYLPNGMLLAAGGTAYYSDPGVEDPPAGAPSGVAELEGLRSARIYDPASKTWTQAKEMNFGRWYPTMVTLPDGDQFIASGVKRLLKTIYLDDPMGSGRNVVQTETFDVETGEWNYNGPGGDRSLPLFPRLHLLPNGHVFYSGGGQVFNPNGYAYDEALWNMPATYDPAAGQWTDLNLANPTGFRGSAFSVMLPLQPDEEGQYTEASFLAAGGTLGTSPGSYFATPLSSIQTVDTANGNELTFELTGLLNERRWYSSGVLLPDNRSVLALSGASDDEVVGPGTGEPRNTAELFDLETKEWRQVATSQQIRSYHNTAALLPDGRVLVGGHAPISTLYGFNITLPTRTPNDGRDPSFEIYSPPYLFYGDRPVIQNVSPLCSRGKSCKSKGNHTGLNLSYGQTFTITTDVPADEIESVVLVRNSSVTHLVDGDQRNVVLQVLSRSGNTLTVAGAPDGAVAPPGPYMLFINKTDDQGPIPSVSAQITVGG